MTLSAALAQAALHDHLLKKYNATPNLGSGADDTLPARKFSPLKEVTGAAGSLIPIQGKVGIVGAGVCGLYLALMLRYLGFSDFDILESSQRVGGRCYTQKFAPDSKCPHNYYDIGAMRIPDIEAMKSTLNLIDFLKLQNKKAPYVLHDAKLLKEPNLYWYQPITTEQMEPYTARFSNAISRFITALETNFDVGFKSLMGVDPQTGAIPDEFSTRGWLMQFEYEHAPLSAPTNNTLIMAVTRKMTHDAIEKAETFETSTGLFNQGFVETLCDYYDFDAAGNAPWYRLDGGMSILTDTMRETVASVNYPEPGSKAVQVSTGQKVIAMQQNILNNNISVTIDNGGAQRGALYETVFNTTAMGCLQQMDLSNLGLDRDILQGIRTLNYDRASKVAIKFSRNWWRDLVALPTTPQDKRFGGVSASDLIISNVVYPSWDDGLDAHTVLIVSYTWAQDATRISSLIPPYKPDGPVTPSKSDPLVNIVLKKLSNLFATVPQAPSYLMLQNMYLEHHAFAWSHDSNTAGAFALFGPGQFRNVYPHFQTGQCKNRFWICGEAVSAHHAWISGSLDSAYTALSSWLLSIGAKEALEKLKASPFGDGKGKHVKELDETLTWWKVMLAQDQADDEDLSKAPP